MRPRILRPIAFFFLIFWVGILDDQASSETPPSETIQLLQAENADTIALGEKVAFMSPSGQEVILSNGTYRVEPVGPSALRLIPFGAKEVFVIKAESTRHEEDIGFPVALTVVDDEYLFHIVLLLPEQKGLEAIGSSSRGRSRGAPELLLTSAEIHDALMRRKADSGATQSPASSRKP